MYLFIYVFIKSEMTNNINCMGLFTRVLGNGIGNWSRELLWYQSSLFAVFTSPTGCSLILFIHL